MHSEIPFHDIKLSDDELIRTFDADVDELQLKWHQDDEDRLVYILEAGGWKIQLENNLPTYLSAEECLEIPRLEWHRVHKGDGNLVVRIKKIK